MIEIPGVGMVRISAIDVICDASGGPRYMVMIGGHAFEVNEKEMSREFLVDFFRREVRREEGKR